MDLYIDYHLIYIHIYEIQLPMKQYYIKRFALDIY